MKTNIETSLVPFSSRLGVETFNSEFDNLVDRMFNSFWHEPSFLFQRNWRASDVNEDKDNYHIDIELPGFKRSEVNVSVVNNTLKVSAKNNRSTYSRAFSISGWDLNKTKSVLENGVLSVTIPKNEEAKERVIDIDEVKDLTEKVKNLPPVEEKKK